MIRRIYTLILEILAVILGIFICYGLGYLCCNKGWVRCNPNDQLEIFLTGFIILAFVAVFIALILLGIYLIREL